MLDGNLSDGQSLLRNVDGAHYEIVLVLLIGVLRLLGLQMLLVVPDVSCLRYVHISKIDRHVFCICQAALGRGARIALISSYMLLLDANVLLDGSVPLEGAAIHDFAFLRLVFLLRIFVDIGVINSMGRH